MRHLSRSRAYGYPAAYTYRNSRGYDQACWREGSRTSELPKAVGEYRRIKCRRWAHSVSRPASGCVDHSRSCARGRRFDRSLSPVAVVYAVLRGGSGSRRAAHAHRLWECGPCGRCRDPRTGISPRETSASIALRSRIHSRPCRDGGRERIDQRGASCRSPRTTRLGQRTCLRDIHGRRSVGGPCSCGDSLHVLRFARRLYRVSGLSDRGGRCRIRSWYHGTAWRRLSRPQRCSGPHSRVRLLLV